MRKYILLALSTLFILFCIACSDWLDVQPSDRVSEENAFSTTSGFKRALNGVYVELNRPALYGQALTCEFVEILAQRYAIANEAKSNIALAKYEYSGAEVRGRIQDIWAKGYNLIANVNLILKNCETHREVLSDDYYQMIKGESLALRAMLHFDLFRLFGPVYVKDSLLISMPYYTEFVLNVNPSLQANDFMDQVILDLTNAEKALEEDPIRTKGVKGDVFDTFKSFRNLRLNYYAVQALLARAYLYVGDNKQALFYSKKVIEAQREWFPWIELTNIATSNDPDRVFSTELLFCLQNENREQIFTQFFDVNSLKTEELLAPKDDIVMYIFEDQKEDLRYKGSFGSPVELGGTNYALFRKYQGRDSIYSDYIPILRVSEAFLMATEIELKENSDQAELYFNELRTHRGVGTVSKGSIDWMLPNEWSREFWGEGQLFFYHKRRQLTEFVSPYALYETVSVTGKNYVLPIPNGETQYN